jgi:hypothetical protein
MRGERIVELGKNTTKRGCTFSDGLALAYYKMYLQLNCGWEALGKRFTTCSIGYGKLWQMSKWWSLLALECSTLEDVVRRICVVEAP